ncbi:hypothetical protein [Hungatella sp.]|uniref:hypothetical protein n=1 Tax=Hungatella sp. TaxID=2613924 RepID=UPI0039920BEA
MAGRAIMANKMRSFLTMLGIIIGIGSTVMSKSFPSAIRCALDCSRTSVRTRGHPGGGIHRIQCGGMCGTAIAFTLDELDKIKEEIFRG